MKDVACFFMMVIENVRMTGNDTSPQGECFRSHLSSIPVDVRQPRNPERPHSFQNLLYEDSARRSRIGPRAPSRPHATAYCRSHIGLRATSRNPAIRQMVPAPAFVADASTTNNQGSDQNL